MWALLLIIKQNDSWPGKKSTPAIMHDDVWQ